MQALARPTIRLDYLLRRRHLQIERCRSHLVECRSARDETCRPHLHPSAQSDVVFAAALGDIFGPNEERGVFRTLDGGKTWEKVLYRSADTDSVDLSLDPNNPRVIFATFWETRRSFWNLSAARAAVCFAPPMVATAGKRLPARPDCPRARWASSASRFRRHGPAASEAMKCSTGAGRTARTISISGNNDRAASHCPGNNDRTARRMTPHHVRTRRTAITGLARIG
jgi:hypothetical protein